MSFFSLDLLYGFLASWAAVILLFYGLLEHRKERLRMAISATTLIIGVIFAFALGQSVAQAIVFLTGWAVPCIVHMLFGRAPGMFVLRVVTRIFRGKPNSEE